MAATASDNHLADLIRLELITDALPVLVSYVDAGLCYQFNNRTYELWFGQSREALRGRHMREVLGEEAFARLEPALSRVLAGETVYLESTLPYKDAGTRDVEVRYVPHVVGGRTLGFVVFVEDVSARRKALDALKESEARFRNMADHAPVMIWMTEPDGRCTYLSKSWYEFTGQTSDSGLGFGWLDAVHPEDRDTAASIYRASVATRTPFRLDYRLRRADGEFRWAIDAAAPRLGEHGEFLGFIGSVIDITDRKLAEQHRELLLGELNHRVKNTLAIVQSIAQQTQRSAQSPAEFHEAFGSRLQALARVHDILTRESWEGVLLSDVVTASLAPFADALRRSRVVVSGSHVKLAPTTAVSLSMAFHELATNAAKYGALSNEAGQISIDWDLASDARATILAIEWVERGGPRVTPPIRRGFGSRLIEKSLARELDGEVRLEFGPEGVECRLRFPLLRPMRMLRPA